MNRMGKGLQSILNAVAIVKERKPGRGKKRKKKKFRGGSRTRPCGFPYCRDWPICPSTENRLIVCALSSHDTRRMPREFPEIQSAGSLIVAWQVKNKNVLVVGGGEVSRTYCPVLSPTNVPRIRWQLVVSSMLSMQMQRSQSSVRHLV